MRLACMTVLSFLLSSHTAFAQRPDPEVARSEIAAINEQVQEARNNVANARAELARDTIAVAAAGNAVATQYHEIAEIVSSLANGFPNEVAGLNAARLAMVESPSRRSQSQVEQAEQALEQAVANSALGINLSQARARLIELVEALTATREEQESSGNLLEQHRLALLAFENTRRSIRERLAAQFDANAPGYATRVDVRAGNSLVHRDVWTEPEESDLIQSLRLANYIEADLIQVLEQRDIRVGEFLADTQEALEYANLALQDYIDWVGSNNPPGNWATIEAFLDDATETIGLGRTGGALVTVGTGTRDRIRLQIADSGLTIGRDLQSGIPPWLSVSIELIGQLSAASNRQSTWNVLRLPQTQTAVDGQYLEGLEEQQFLAALNSARIRSALEVIRDQVGHDALGESYMQTLTSQHQEHGLALAMGHSIYRNTAPQINISAQDLRTMNPVDWVFAQIENASVIKSVFKSTVESFVERAAIDEVNTAMRRRVAVTLSESSAGRSAASRSAARPWHRVVATGLALDFIQAATFDTLQGQIEERRLSLWAQYISADMNRQASLNMLQNEGRVRRYERRLLELIREVQETLRVELELEQGSRLRATQLDQALADEFEVEIEFSQPVTVTSARVGDLVLASNTNGPVTVWTGRGHRDDIGQDSIYSGYTNLEVLGFSGTNTEDPLDGDPSTVASFDTTNGNIPGYETEPMRIGLRIDPPDWEAAYGIVLDTSGSMSGSRFASAQQSLIDMFDIGLMNERTIASVTTFRRCSLYSSDYTNDYEELGEHIRRQETGGGTPLANAIQATARDLLLNTNAERRYLIIMTDGEESCDGSVIRAMRYARGVLSGAEEF